MTGTSMQPLKYLDQAIGTIRSLGLPEPASVSSAAVAIASKLAVIDETKTIAVARVLGQAPYFNEMVRSQLSGSTTETRYESIVSGFDSIRDDAKRMVVQLDDGRADFKERASNLWMRATRGDIPSRFNRISKIFQEVTSDSRKTIDRDQRILDAYKDFRLAMKEGEITASDIMAAAAQRLDASKAVLKAAQAAVDAGDKADAAAYGRLELARDEALRTVQDDEKLFGTASSLSKNLNLSYASSESIMARLTQYADVRERVYSESVTFFGTCETVITGLSAAFTSQANLNESTKALTAMQDGVSKALDTLADIGGKALDDGLKAAYGPGIRSESIKNLVESIVGFQERSRAGIAEQRALSDKNVEEARAAVEDGKRRFAELAQSA